MQKNLEFSPLSSLPLFWVCPFVFVLFLKPTEKKLFNIIMCVCVCIHLSVVLLPHNN